MKLHKGIDMNHPANKLCIVLDEHDITEDTERDETDSLDNPEEEVWHFDPGICG